MSHADRWRDAQTKHKSRWDGVHPERFSCWRWEAQITEFKEYKDEKLSDTKDNTSWQKSTEQRKNWKEHEQEFGMETEASSNSLQKQRENKKKTAATFQEIHEGFLVEKKHLRNKGFAMAVPYFCVSRRRRFYLHRGVDGQVHPLDGLHHLKKEDYAFLEFLTINFPTGAPEIIRECESENQCETSVRRKEAHDRRLRGLTCLVLAREGYRQYNQIKGEELFKTVLGKKAICNVRKMRRMNGSLFPSLSSAQLSRGTTSRTRVT